MRVYRYWARGTASMDIGHGGTQESVIWGGSNVSEAEARDAVAEKIRKIQAKINGSYHEFDDYEVEIREEILAEPSPVSVVTRNRYGAEILCVENQAILDIDEAPVQSGWKSLFRRREPGTPKEKMLAHIRTTAESPGFSGLGFRVYETFAGYRVWVTGREIESDNTLHVQLCKSFNVDWLYDTLCRKQKCYRARLTPKPYRMKARTRRNRFPRGSQEDQNEYESWVKDYEQALSGFSTCRYVETLGPETTNELITYHDERTGAFTSRPLA